MSIRYSIAQRTPSLNSLFAGLACAISLTLTAGPALAQTEEMGRVEISGRVVEAPIRYDVHANCQGIEDQLQSALDLTWLREGRYGEVKVQLALENGEVSGVEAKGISNIVARQVRNAVNRLDCGPQSTSGTQIYSFSVDFIDPAMPASAAQYAKAKRTGTRIALVSR
ncbi:MULTISPECIES: hypothetical protein [unclassified Roseateles]|uniref:hypothetical protein n=1 Tax=unclassified Roseateles TaxID=2626991 RepID=UPI0006F65C73|nr:MULTISPECIES: hypothetical protein [unclassified Roseateles]KQW41992.1 hypothetical protein ASC81_22035 [Pelomonas sp. Root405]KRA67595.1 hypothetical protein ASD88_23620 [Pelomonas sp. Root662]